jgi:nitrite reductase/ring-hydroxylating ferredoxin subunit
MLSTQNGEAATRRLSRREALSTMAGGSVVLAAVIVVLVFLRLPIPPGLRERTIVRVGSPDRFPFNIFTSVPDKNIFIYRTRGGFKALSAPCSHLGCVVAIHGSGFRCPCHGSTFDSNGAVLDGPAPRPLSWLRVGMSADGQLTVNTAERVPMDQLFTV